MFKAGVAVLAAVAVSFGGLLVAPAPPAHAAATTEGLVAWYKLDETGGTVAADASGNGRTATVDGAANWNSGNGFVFGGGSASSGNAIKLPDNITAGLDAITVAFDVWVDPTLSGNHFVYNLGNVAVGTPQSGTGYLFTTTTPYRSVISPAAWGGEKVTSKGSNLTKGTWKHLTYSQSGTTGTLYENGVQVAQNTAVTTTPAQLGNGVTTRNVIGRSAYAADNSFKGAVSDFRIYNRALTSDEISVLADESMSALATADADWVTSALGDVSAVTTALTLPTTGPARASISWASANPDAISATGVVTRGPADTTVELTATITAGSSTLTRVIPVTVKGSTTAEQDAVEEAAAALTINGIDDVRSNITLPVASSVPGVTVTWSSSATATIDATGIVNRPAHGQADTTVVLTATVTKGSATTTRDFTATVPASPEVADYEAYLFSYFTGDSVAGEKIYFGASNGNDARNWVTLNNSQPLLTSNQGTTGLRDPFIVRSPEGDRFYLIATDLSIGGGTSWDASQRTGSKSIEVWESTDLVNWSDQRHVKVSPDTAGNTWAPEAYWDDTIGAYVVFWASKLYAESDPGHTGSAPNVMMYATTRDFVTFTPAQQWQNTGVSRIDSTVIKVGDTYHRFTKDEASSLGCLDVFEETSTDLRAITTKTSATGTWALQNTCIGKNAGTGAVEGPSIVKANPGDAGGDGYYLFVDEFSGRKYIPLYSNKLGADASWSIPTSYSLPNPAPRHGTVLPITAEEQERIFSAMLPAAQPVAPVALSTPVGTAAVLPTTVPVTFADGSSRGLAVNWEQPPAGYFDEAGVVEITGTVTGIGQTVTARITVVDAAGDLLLHYTFDNITGTVVPDSSPFANNGVLKGTGATVADGALKLPGGASSSSAAYVQLPTGMFDGHNKLTVSAWLKNEQAAGNFAALFFGTTQSSPTQYWLLNPRNPANQVKSVITDGLNSSAPWGTEAGTSPTTASRGVPGPAATNEWAFYTTVIEPGKITVYLDGRQVGSVATSRSVSSFGQNLVAFIGKSSYPDAIWKGAIGDLTVHSTALSAAQISAAYLEGTGDAAKIDAALQADADAIDLGSAPIVSDLDLPTTGARGSQITWTSSNDAVLAADGTVVRPPADDAEVSLTATLQLAGRTLTREIVLTVLAGTPQKDVDHAAAGFDLAITHITSDIALRTLSGDVSIVWTSSEPSVIATSGAVNRQSTETAVTLTATFSRAGATATREFPVTVLAADAGRIGSYIRTGDTARTDVLHLATSNTPAAAGAVYTAVNNGRAVLYPSAGSTKFAAPALVRAPDGTFRLISPEDGNGTRLYVYNSTDLTKFTNERLVSFTAAPLGATAVSADYDNGIGAYRLSFTATGDGKRYQVTTADFSTFTAPVLVSGSAAVESGAFPSGALSPASVGVTATELARVTTAFGRVVNTGVRSFADVLTDDGATAVLPETATVEYSSGETSSMHVTWNADDVAALSGAEPGSYVIDGTVQRTTYPNPLVERRADPDVTLGDDGLYYFTGSYPMTSASDPNGYDRVVLRRAATIQELGAAPEVTIWHENTDPVLNRYIWAPELTKIGDDWYILFTASRNGVWDIRPAMLKYTGGEFGGDAVLDPANWTSIGQVKAVAGDTAAFTSFSLDMTHFESNGKHYLVWAEKPAGGSTLRMAEIDPANPAQLITPSILLSAPTLAWEKNNGDAIDEGPAVITKDGKVIIAFSAATVDDKYCVGVLTADASVDLMDPLNWTKNPFPLLTTDDVPGQVGPGHNSFTVDELGNPVIVYHSRTVGDTANPGEATDAGLFDPRRHARAATVHWNADGLPVFAITATEELDPAFAAVSVRVVVGDDTTPEAPTVSAVVTPGAADGANGWYLTVPTVALSLSDGAVADLEYRVDGASWAGYSTPVALTGDGSHTLEYRASVAGVPVDSSVGSVAASIDTTVPVASAALTPADGIGSPASPVVATLSASDATSGVERIEYRVNGGDWTAYGSPITFDTVGSALIEYRAFDAAGLVSDIGVASAVISEVPEVRGTLTLSSSVVTAGDTLTVRGSGFQAGERVSLTLHSDPVLLGYATADDSGAFTTDVTVPAATVAGSHTLRAAGEQSGTRGEAALRVLVAQEGDSGNGKTPGADGASSLGSTGFGAVGFWAGGLALALAGLALILVRRRARA